MAKPELPFDLIRWNLTNHRPTDEEIARIEALREVAILFGQHIMAECPGTRERSIALTKLEESVMWAVASVARNTAGEG